MLTVDDPLDVTHRQAVKTSDISLGHSQDIVYLANLAGFFEVYLDHCGFLNSSRI